jgi:3-oxoacyl-[acyl-carrier protein] reductase
VDSIQTKHLDLQLGVNLRGLILVTREALPLLRESPSGWIVNLASIAGTTGVPELPVYAATKAAVINFTHSLNRGESHVRACALCPGFVDTPMTTFTGLASEEMIQPEDCAEVVRLLLRLSPRARIPEVVIERLGENFV